MRTLDFDFYLPEHLIAQHPTASRTASRLLKMDGLGNLSDDTFSHVTDCFEAGDVLILNDTKVIKARLFGQKSTGGQIEVMIDRIINNHDALVQIKASRSPKAGARLTLSDAIEVEVLGRKADMFHVKFLNSENIYSLLERHGELPLPPYIAHPADKQDEQRYQTVFAKHEGAVAAPTAGLHFDEALLQSLHKKGVQIHTVTLHVGAGTFQPVKVDDVRDHHMHSEQYHLPEATVVAIKQAQALGKPITAVGTTVMRTLESAAQKGMLNAHHGETNIFITPGFEFQVVDRLITNFHLPKSTLMMLVSAFSGIDEIRKAYAHAISKEYRFFSYGDAMLLERKNRSPD